MKRFTAILLSILMLCAVLTANATQYPYTSTDTAGAEFTIEALPERVVSLAASNTEILYSLGVLDKVVGIDAYSNYPTEGLEGAQIVGDYSGANIEVILSLEPDVVFAGNYIQQDLVDALKEAGITVVSVEATSYDDIRASIALTADVMNVDAADVIAVMDDEQAQAIAAAAQNGMAGKHVYYALSFGEYGDWTAGDGTFISQMLALLGAVNVADGMGIAWPMYSIEQLLEDDPDIILVPGDAQMVEQFTRFDSYQHLTAVQNGSVYSVDNDMSSRPGPRITKALLEFANVLTK